MALETLKIIELELEFSVLDKCPRNWERPDLNVAGCIVKPLEYADALNVFWALLHGQS